MEINHRRFLPVPRGGATRATLVGMFGLLALTWLYYQHAVTDPMQLYGVEIATAKEWVKHKARDPRSVNFENIRVYNNEWREVCVSFSWDDGKAGKSEKRWRFDFNRETGRLQFVNDEGTGKMVGYGEEVLAQMRAAEVRREHASQARTNAAIKEAQWKLSNAPMVPGATPGIEAPVRKKALPMVPGLGGH